MGWDGMGRGGMGWEWEWGSNNRHDVIIYFQEAVAAARDKTVFRDFNNGRHRLPMAPEKLRMVNIQRMTVSDSHYTSRSDWRSKENSKIDPDSVPT
jgi:hypothetical protein